MSAATTTRAVIYCRVSTDEQAAQGESGRAGMRSMATGLAEAQPMRATPSSGTLSKPR